MLGYSVCNCMAKDNDSPTPRLTVDATDLPEQRVSDYQEYGLSEQQANVLVAKERGLTDREVADALGMSDGTVKSHMARARKKYRDAKALMEMYEEMYNPTAVSRIGFYDSEFVTPNGTLGADGWLERPSTTFKQNQSNDGSTSKWALSPSTEDYNSDSVVDLLEALPVTQIDDQMIPVIGWYYAAPFASLIHDLEGVFPSLQIVGETGSGKTATADLLAQMFGWGSNSRWLTTATMFSQITAMSSSTSAPIWIDEYNPDSMKPNILDRFHETIRRAYQGGIERRGNADRSVTEYLLEAPVVVTGGERYTEESERRRSIGVKFSPESIQNEVNSKAFDRLSRGAHADHALAFYQYALSLDSEVLTNAWDAASPPASLSKQAPDPEDKVRLQTLRFGLDIYQSFSDEFGAEGILAIEDVQKNVGDLVDIE